MQIWGVLLLSLKVDRRINGLCLAHDVIFEHVLPHDLMSPTVPNIQGGLLELRHTRPLRLIKAGRLGRELAR